MTTTNQNEDNNNFDKDRYHYCNQLNLEQNAQLKSQLDECRDDDLCFVTDWYDDSRNIVGVGVSYLDSDCTIRSTLNVQPGLFVLSGDVNTLRVVASLYGYDTVHVYKDAQYQCNNFTILDVMVDRDQILNNVNYLCKIVTPTTTASNRLHGTFKRDNEAKYKFAAVTHYWNVAKQVMFELICAKRSKDPHDLTVPKISYRWFDKNLQPYILDAPNVPIITFDIETVSTDPYRVPTGEDVNDVLFTTSIHHVNDHKLYTLVYLPLKRRTCDELLNEMRTLDEYYEYEGQTNIVEVFRTELDLLKRTMKLLRYPSQNNGALSSGSKLYQNRNRLHYIIGYNSMRYDMKYLLLRCQFYGIHGGEFVYKNGYSFGFGQIHIDLFCVAMMRYKLKNYKLDTLSATILNSQKENVDAVALRYTFHHLRTTQRLYAHDDVYMRKNNMPSLRDTLHYNNRDTLLVSELVAKTDTIKYVFEYSHNSRVPFHSVNVNHNKIKFRLLNQCEVTGLESGKFFTNLKSSRNTMIIPLHVKDWPIQFDEDRMIPHDFTCMDIDNETLLGSKILTNGKKKRYPGGVNYCRGEYDVQDVQEYDYRIAYPMLMDLLNLSDETCAIMTARNVATLYPFIKNKHEYRTFDYNTHVSDTKTGTRILLHRYLYDDLNPGSEFEFNLQNLYSREDAPIIVIWYAKNVYRGILSEIIKSFNEKRQSAKVQRSYLANRLDTLDQDIEDCINRFDELDMDNNNDDEHDGSTQMETIIDDANDNNDGDDDCAPLSPGELNDDGDDDDCAPLSPSDLNDDDDDDCAPLSPSDFNNDDADKKNNKDNDDDDDDCAPLSPSDLNEEEEKKEKDEGRIDVSDSRDDEMEQRKKPIKLIHNFDNEYIEEEPNGDIEFLIPENVDNEERLSILRKIRDDVQLKHDALDNLYLTLKPVVASIYGVIGAMKPEMAASITCIIRTTLLNEARYAIETGRQVYYCDTDCIQMDSGPNLTSTLNTMYPYTELEMSEKGQCMYVRPKVYYRYVDGNIKYGANTNGPIMWRRAVEYFEQRRDIATSMDVLQSFRNFFQHVYDVVLEDCARHPEDEFYGFRLLTQDIKITTRESTKDLRKYLSERYPSLAGAFRQNVYYFQDESDITQTIYRPSIETCSRENEAFARVNEPTHVRRIARLRKINLFKFFYSSFSTIFNLLNFHVKRNNEPFHVSLNDTHVRYLMLCGYLDTYHAFLMRNESCVYKSFLPIVASASANTNTKTTTDTTIMESGDRGERSRMHKRLRLDSTATAVGSEKPTIMVRDNEGVGTVDDATRDDDLCINTLDALLSRVDDDKNKLDVE